MAASQPSNIRIFPKGTVIIEEGPASPKELIVILQGTAGVFRNYGLNTQRQLRVLSQGEFHGELTLFMDSMQLETVVALGSVTVLRINRGNLTEFFQTQPAMAVNIVEGICKKLSDPPAAEAEPPADTAPRRTGLFPETHGSYRLSMDNGNELLYPTKTVCPLCGQTFDSLTAFESRLGRGTTDTDLRVRYPNFEPLLYEILTCPNCFLSASSSRFERVEKRYANAVNQAVGPYKLEMYIRTGRDRDTFTVFAGYYLALLLAPVVFADEDFQLITASLWLKLSRLYQDCGDQPLFLYTSGKALEDYLFAYNNLRISEKQTQHVCYMIGEMYCRLRDWDRSRNFFFLAKTNKQGTPVMQRQADLRIDDVREQKQAEAAGKTGQ